MSKQYPIRLKLGEPQPPKVQAWIIKAVSLCSFMFCHKIVKMSWSHCPIIERGKSSTETLNRNNDKAIPNQCLCHYTANKQIVNPYTVNAVGYNPGTSAKGIAVTKYMN